MYQFDDFLGRRQKHTWTLPMRLSQIALLDEVWVARSLVTQIINQLLLEIVATMDYRGFSKRMEYCSQM